MKYKIVFSVPVHESLNTVMDFIENCFCFNPDSAIIIHISPSYKDTPDSMSLESFLKICPQNVFINPTRVRTGFFDIIQTHISNFIYAYEELDFEYFVMRASNDLCVRKGLYERIVQNDCGVGRYNLSSRFWKGNLKDAKKDDSLSRIRARLNCKKIFWSQIEGTYYKKELFKTICDIIESEFDYRNTINLYPREEIYFPTIIQGLINTNNPIAVDNKYTTFIPWRRVNMMVTLSEAIRFSRGNKYFFIKRVDRKIDDYVRSYFRQAFKYDVKLSNYGICIPNYNLKLLRVKAPIAEHIKYIKQIVAIVKWNGYLFIKSVKTHIHNP